MKIGVSQESQQEKALQTWRSLQYRHRIKDTIGSGRHKVQAFDSEVQLTVHPLKPPCLLNMRFEYDGVNAHHLPTRTSLHVVCSAMILMTMVEEDNG